MDCQHRTIGHFLIMKRTIRQIEDGVDRIGVINVVGSYARGVGSPSGLPVSNVPTKIVRLQIEQEQLAFFEILVP